LPTYYNALRPEPHYRREIFDAGLQAVGFKPADHGKCDVYLTWNRYGTRERLADQVEARGGRVLVAENATWGNDFLEGRWYSIWVGFHNRADMIRDGGAARWDSLGAKLETWRPAGGEIVGLEQRGIGPAGTPKNWVPPGCTRIRKHPGVRPCVALDKDLAKASEVRTWGSGAAVKALLWGIRVRSYMPQWCGEQQNTDDSRLEMFRRLAWAQWRHEEIASGLPFRWVL
jgi:hypothetical protein